MEYIRKLIRNAESALVASPARKFEMQDIGELTGVGNAIYIIRQVGGNPTDTFEALKAYKQTKERACPKMNSPCEVLYVGSSTTGVKNRIRQHLGDGPGNTYALHLKHWFRGETSIQIQEYNVSREVLQIIEDGIAAALKPAFGKSGSNNK